MICRKNNASSCNCCKSIVSKATESLNCLRRSLFACSRGAKFMAYRALAYPILEYTAVVWCPYTTKDIKLLESLQGRAARWICGSHWRRAWTIPTDVCYSQLALPFGHTPFVWNYIPLHILQQGDVLSFGCNIYVLLRTCNLIILS